MKNRNTGLYYFGKSLGQSLIKNNDDLDFTYYVPKKEAESFPGVRLINHSRLHKFFFPNYREFDLVHFTHQYSKLNPDKIAGRKILTVHDLNQIHESENKNNAINKHLSRLSRFINSVDRVVAISNFVANDIVRYFPECAHKLSVIYNGAEKLQVSGSHVPKYLPRKPFLFTIGILDPRKNFHVLPSLLKNKDFELVISGIIDHKYEQRILSEAAKYNSANRVKITGPISDEDKAWYYKNCYAFVFPSIAEGFGLPVIEAMHFGKPVFLSKKTSLPEIGGNVAFYFENFDPTHMLEVFQDGMNEYEQKKLTNAIMSHANKFSWNQAAIQYLNLYKSL